MYIASNDKKKTCLIRVEKFTFFKYILMTSHECGATLKGIWLQMKFDEIFWVEEKIDALNGEGDVSKREMIILFSRRQTIIATIGYCKCKINIPTFKCIICQIYLFTFICRRVPQWKIIQC